MNSIGRRKEAGVSLVEFVIRAFAAAVGKVPQTVVEWKIRRIVKRIGR